MTVETKSPSAVPNGTGVVASSPADGAAKFAAIEALGKSIGNQSMAAAILAIDDGVLPSDTDALNDFLVVTSGEATKALKRYVKLNSTIGKRLSDAYREWKGHKDREARIFAIIANGGTIPEPPATKA